jgi:hypothetical protein
MTTINEDAKIQETAATPVVSDKREDGARVYSIAKLE